MNNNDVNNNNVNNNNVNNNNMNNNNMNNNNGRYLYKILNSYIINIAAYIATYSPINCKNC